MQVVSCEAEVAVAAPVLRKRAIAARVLAGDAFAARNGV